MKTIVLLCLLVTLCAAQRFPPNNILNQAAQAVKNAKNSVNSIMSDMERTRRQLDMSMSSEISNNDMQGFRTIIDSRDRRLNYIKEKVKEAEASGKDATNCLNAVSDKVKSAGQKGHNDITSCTNTAKQQWNAEMRKFDAAKTTGQRMVNDIDRIALECYQSDAMQMANCMITKVAVANLTIREYKQTVANIEREVRSNKINITSAQYSCNSNAINSYRSVDSSAIYEAADCLKN